jgi:hypothetical protein
VRTVREGMAGHLGSGDVLRCFTAGTADPSPVRLLSRVPPVVWHPRSGG